jgi:hypothetical protein
MRGVPAAEVSLVGEPRSASVARRFLAETLADWGCAAFETTASLLLTELVANAALHAKTQIVVRLQRVADGLRIEVADESPRIPVQRHYSAQATTGRGLGLVASLARAWGTWPHGAGKIVWCEIGDDEAMRGADGTSDAADLDAIPDLDGWPDVEGHAGPRVGRSPRDRASNFLPAYAA